MKKLTFKGSPNEVTNLPPAFVLCENNTYRVRDKITVTDIMTAAQSILAQQCQTSPLVLNNVNLAKQLAVFRLAEMKSECFCVMFLDNQHKLIRFEKLFQGTINQTAVYPREIAKRAFELNAAAIILVHKHPSGDCTPSRTDEWLTTAIKSAFKLMDINVVDHFIVAGNQAYSFAENSNL